MPKPNRGSIARFTMVVAAALAAASCKSQAEPTTNEESSGGSSVEATSIVPDGTASATGGRTSSTKSPATSRGGNNGTIGGSAVGGFTTTTGNGAQGGGSLGGATLALGGATATGGAAVQANSNGASSVVGGVGSGAGTRQAAGVSANAGVGAIGGVSAVTSLVRDKVMSSCETPFPAALVQRIEAECAFGANTGSCKGTIGTQQGTQLENGDADVGYIEAGDSLCYEGVSLSGITTVQLHYAKGIDGGTVEIHLDSVTGQLIGSSTPSTTNSWGNWGDTEVTLSAVVSGTHGLCLVFKGGSGGILNLDWFQLSAGTNVAAPLFHLNQVGFDTLAGKHAVIEGPAGLGRFHVVGSDGTAAWCGDLTAQSFEAWGSANSFYSVDFTELTRPGSYRLQVGSSASSPFVIADNLLYAKTAPSILAYFKGARADDADVWAADERISLNGTSTVADVRGGWYDASGDISKYLTHLSYTNFMLPQQIPLVAWAMAWTYDKSSSSGSSLGNGPALQAEALWGADYLLRVLDPQGYFYTTVFDNWSGSLSQRQVCAFSGEGGATSSNYQSALREGGGMSIAALARIAHWNTAGAFKSSQYLEGAQRAFDLLNTNGVQFADDGKENIIDDYTGLLAATELYATTSDASYLDAARARAGALLGRLNTEGYFIADGANRPFWHASDAGLPVIALARYAQVEMDLARGNLARQAIRSHLGYLLRVTRGVANPFGYARQPISATATGFFIPHDNESGYWWQGENARLGSLAAAAALGAEVAGASGVEYLDWLRFASAQLDWILGSNPYDVCFLKGFGTQNPPDFCAAKSQWNSFVGGIANGITGKNPDGSGIQWPSSTGCGDGWRWVEQWIPHAAWYLVAVSAIAK